MVHLARIPTDLEATLPVVEGIERINIEDLEPSTITTSVYGSRFAAEDIPRHEMPEREMPKEIAYRAHLIDSVPLRASR